jgi:hypothetical protein
MASPEIVIVAPMVFSRSFSSGISAFVGPERRPVTKSQLSGAFLQVDGSESLGNKRRQMQSLLQGPFCSFGHVHNPF